jgi:ornithine lipid ester-linked acyl 2-hydroxylase
LAGHAACLREIGKTKMATTTSSAGKKTVRDLRREFIVQNGQKLFRAVNRYFAKQSLVPDDPVLNTALFPWIAELEQNWPAIQKEAMAVLQRRESLPFFQDISPDQKRISPDDKWRTFFFYGFGNRSERNCEFCPQTARLLEKVPGIENAFLSILAPGKIIPSHRGISKGLIRGHLGIVIPPTPADCFMDVGDVRCTWEEGKVLLFDDTYPHAVSNLCDQERVVLLFDFPRPMKLPGRVLRSVLFWAFRHTAYVQDALRNEARWSAANYPAA